ncbi:putative WRKY transcription factor 41 [Iris pallida]|uniref:WRKY transcription factor 41 n=1 Tax=Iris pallida TaxID=29817 RepID=A0AAX6GW61_IRIPA|nr:putative WRKY transcription factor 41 [Iris pallida]
MEMGSNLVLDELARGRELVTKLRADIELTTSFSVNARRAVVEDLLSSLEKCISMVTESSPRPQLTESPRSEGRGRGPGVVRKDSEMCKKRRTQAKWTRKVRLGTGPGVDGPVDDGYKWRKYGQKDILEAKYPRGYFRCSHLKTQGCLATKQVQRSEDNPSAVDVTYRGAHTCRRESAPPQAPDDAPPQHQNSRDDSLLLSFQTGLNVKTEGLEEEDSSPPLSFSFPSKPEVPTFSPSSTLDGCFVGGGGGGGWSGAFVSPATSETTNYYFSMSPAPNE